MKIEKDYCVRVNFGEEQELVSRVFDHIHVFKPLGHAILKLVTEEGFKQWHMPIEQAEHVAEASGIIPIERTEISETEYDAYLRYREATIDDSWLSD